MATIQVLSPVALGPAQTKALAARVPSLRGKVLGIRIDHAWPSWWRYADELKALATDQLGVRNVVIFDPESRIGAPEAESAKVVAFARSVDAAVVGLGT